MSAFDSCKEGANVCKESSDVDVCDMTEKLQSMSAADNNHDVNVPVCANCGKESSDVNNVCNKCKQVKYCNASCKKKHRHKHKKECYEHIKQAAKHAAELHDKKLFKHPPPKEDCPICYLPLPSLTSGFQYMLCCGKIICSGCCYAPVYNSQGNKVNNKKCPFCRTRWPTSDEEDIRRVMIRIDAGDALAMYYLGCLYRDGKFGLPQDYTKSIELFHRAGEFGSDYKLGQAAAYNKIGYAYNHGEGVEVDEEKANHYYELGAIGGNVLARYNLGAFENNRGNKKRAVKHYMTAAESGHDESLKKIKELYSTGHASKEDYSKALQSYQVYLSEIKSRQRDEAATLNTRFRYY